MSDTTRIIIGLVIIGIGIFVVVSIFRTGHRDAPPPPTREVTTVDNYLELRPDFPKNYILGEGQPAPEFTYASMRNEVFRLTDYRNSKYLVLFFFDSESPYCQRQLTELQEFYSLYGSIVEVVGISSQPENMKNIIAGFVQANGVEFPILHDPSGRIDEVYTHGYEPFFAFIGKDGIVIDGYTGTIYEFYYAAWDLFGWIGPSEMEYNNLKTDADHIAALSIDGHAHPYDIDWYVLDGQERTECTFILTYDDTRCTLSLEVYSDESLLGTLNRGSSPDRATFSIPGTCYLKVINTPCQECPYTITLEPK